LGSIGETSIKEPLLPSKLPGSRPANTRNDGRTLSEEFDKRGLRRLRGRQRLNNLWRQKRKQGQQLFGETNYNNDEQFTHLRYTCCVSAKPITFTSDGYRLQCFEKGYRIKCLHVVTMYNEDDKELVRTLRGLCFNLQHLAQVEGPDVWKKFAVAIVIDGRTKANKETLRYASSAGFFSEELMNDALDQNMSPTMHLFEYTAQLKEDENFEKRFPPMQIIFALKEHNGGKLDSHLWFFNAFADQLIPKYCFLLDVGTMAKPRALFKLYRCMETNDRIAGVCGEIACWKPNYLNPVVASQHFEYKVSHILDKALESSFGFISVLPGAFSAYRYEAIKEKDGKGPLVEYFQSITTPMKELGAFKANMYLAEDRILCYEIVARKNCNWILHYVKDAVAETDTPETLDVLIKQRRRWLNGSFFASLYTIIHFNRLWKDATHSLFMKCAFSVQFTYYFFNIVMNWFLPANFYLAFLFLTEFNSTLQTLPAVANVLNLFYVFMTMAQIVLGLGNTPDEMKQMYMFSSLFYGLFAYMVIALSFVYMLSKPPTIMISGAEVPSYVITVAACASIGCFFVAGVLHNELTAVSFSFLQYMFMLPTFTNVFTIYSFCNIHDISWGTREETEEKKVDTSGGGPATGRDQNVDAEQKEANEKQARLVLERKRREASNASKDQVAVEKEFKSFRSALLLSWILTNALFVYLIAGGNVDRNGYVDFLFLTVLAFIGMRFFGSVYFIIDRYAWLGYRKIVKEREEMKKRMLKKQRATHRRKQREALSNTKSEAFTATPEVV